LGGVRKLLKKQTSESTERALETVTLLGLRLHSATVDQAVRAVCDLAAKPVSAMVVTPNVDHVVRLRRDTEFRAAYERAYLRFADGRPLVTLSRLTGKALPQRVAGADLLPLVAREAASRGMRVMMVGGERGVAKAASSALKARLPGLDVAEPICPERGFELSPAASRALADRIRLVAPDIVFLGVGAPKQEKWAAQWGGTVGPCTIVCVGGALDFVAGSKVRAPNWVQTIGFEWLYRLAQEPRRLARRYLVDDLLFFKLATGEILAHRFPLSRRRRPLRRG
jgi:N-acetylglucosaminyldiphosphoundecaprenol N-acetyl-beta-D-mannosaminyltransferase